MRRTFRTVSQRGRQQACASGDRVKPPGSAVSTMVRAQHMGGVARPEIPDHESKVQTPAMAPDNTFSISKGTALNARRSSTSAA